MEVVSCKGEFLEEINWNINEVDFVMSTMYDILRVKILNFILNNRNQPSSYEILIQLNTAIKKLETFLRVAYIVALDIFSLN